MNTQRRKMNIIVLACAFVIGVSTITKTLAHSDLSLHHSPMPIFQSDGDKPNRDPLALKLGRERYHLAQQCNLSWQETEVENNMLFPIGRADRVYSFYDGWGEGVIKCFQRAHGKCKLVYQVNLVCHERRVTKDKPVHVRTRYRTLLDYVTQAMPDDPDNPTTVGYFTLPRTTSRDVRKDLALKRDYVFYSEDRFNDLLYTWLMYDMDKRGKFGAVYNYREDPFTKALISQTQFYDKYGLPVTKEELLKAGLTHGPTKTKH